MEVASHSFLLTGLVNGLLPGLLRVSMGHSKRSKFDVRGGQS